MLPAAIIAKLHLKLTYWGCFICVRQFCITFISFWYSYTSKYRGYINSYKFKREKNYYLLFLKAETFMHGELLGLGARIYCWASPTALRNLHRQFLVTFVEMLRNDSMSLSSNRIQLRIWLYLLKTCSIKLVPKQQQAISPLTQGYWKFCTATRRWGNIVCCSYVLIGWILKVITVYIEAERNLIGSSCFQYFPVFGARF